MAERQAFLTALTELFETQNRIIEGQQATITQLEQEVIARGLPDDQVPQANLDQELTLVQEQQQRLEQMMTTEPIEGTSPEGEPVVIQPEPDAGGGGGDGGDQTTGGETGATQPAEGDEGVPSDANVQPPPTDPAAPPTETEGGAVGNQGGGTAPEPMT